MHLQKTLQLFLQRHRDPTRPVLLALSGGPDSLVLFDLLKKNDIAVAHVDHGWRKESGEEAALLKEMVGEIPFHGKKIPYSPSEDVCRGERLSFFKQLCDEYGYQAVIMGHHKDDQAETVLKRVLEGAALVNIGGMSEVVLMDGLPIWRPFLDTPKKEILKWIEISDLNPFIDSTNEDSKYLRARMRTEIIPELSRSFGKEVKNSLVHLGSEAKEMRTFLDAHLALYSSKIERTNAGSFLDLSEDFPKTLFEMKHLLRIFSTSLPRNLLGTAANFVLTGVANKKVADIYIDRRRLFLPAVSLQSLPEEKVSLTPSFKYGSWDISVRTVESNQHKYSNWKDAWNGTLVVTLPKNSYTIGPPRADRNHEKVPAFLKKLVPVLFLGEEIQHEFLTGKINRETNMCKEWVEISLKRGNFIENESDMCYNEICKGK